MSLDGFVARPDHGTEEVHEASAPVVRDAFELGANVTGRRTFDDAHAWGGDDPMGIPSFVVTHEVPDEWKDDPGPFTFVTDGVESAIRQARAVAGDRPVGVAGGDIAMQCAFYRVADRLPR